MGTEETIKKRKIRYLQWKQSKEYQEICDYLRAECEKLLCVGKEHLPFLREHSEAVKAKAEKVQHAIRSNMHRGFYCPSPIWDIVLNLKRGRITNRITASSKTSHRFGFDTDNRLLYAEALRDGEVLSTEFLFYQDDVCFGITVNADFELKVISKEKFTNQRLVQYSVAVFYPDGDGYFCADLHTETYTYDADGLVFAEERDFQPYVNELRRWRYDFVRKNGYLTTYTVKRDLFEEIEGELQDPIIYTVRMKRKA